MGVSEGLFSFMMVCGGVLSPKMACTDLQLLFPEISVAKDGEKKEDDTYRSCLCSSGKKSKMMKKVRFAPDVVDPRCKNEEYRRTQIVTLLKGKKAISSSNKSYSDMIASGTKPVKFQTLVNPANLPANRAALYNGMLHYRNQIRDKHNYR